VSAVVLLCVPLYVCVGNIMEKSDIGRCLVDFVEVFVGRIRGGLGVVGVFASAVFGSISGNSTATLTCIGGVIIPRMIEKKYPRGHAAALLTNACPLGLLIPPSSSMIIFAYASRQSILACFLATVLPGLILATMLSITNIFMLRRNMEIQIDAPVSPGKLGRQIVSKGYRSIPALLMPVIILGGTYSGVFTPTESAAATVFYAVPVGFLIYKKLTIKGLFDACIVTGTISGIVSLCLSLCRTEINTGTKRQGKETGTL
jgi:tripartite ATP-independent transporter DctM subunit